MLTTGRHSLPPLSCQLPLLPFAQQGHNISYRLISTIPLIVGGLVIIINFTFIVIVTFIIILLGEVIFLKIEKKFK